MEEDSLVSLVKAWAHGMLTDEEVKARVKKLAPVSLVRDGEESYYRGPRENTWVAVLAEVPRSYTRDRVEAFQEKFMKA